MQARKTTLDYVDPQTSGPTKYKYIEFFIDQSAKPESIKNTYHSSLPEQKIVSYSIYVSSKLIDTNKEVISFERFVESIKSLVKKEEV